MVKVVENPTYTNRVPALSAQQVLLCVKLIRLACKRPSAAAAARLPGHRSKTPRGSRDCDSLRFAPPRKKTGDTTSWETPSSCHHVTLHPAPPPWIPKPPGDPVTATVSGSSRRGEKQVTHFPETAEFPGERD